MIVLYGDSVKNVTMGFRGGEREFRYNPDWTAIDAYRFYAAKSKVYFGSGQLFRMYKPGRYYLIRVCGRLNDNHVGTDEK